MPRAAVRLSLSVLLIIGVLTLSYPAVAGEHEGVILPDTMEVNGQTLLLNGMGTRRVTIFGLRVYIAGLYLAHKNSDAKQILDSPDQKYLVMHLVRSVSREDVVEAWTSGLKKNVANPEPYTSQLNAVTTPMADVEPGEQIRVLFETDAVELQIPGDKKFRVEGAGFGKALLSIWIGKHPPNKALKAGLLGLAH